jgi:hypothetical protein
MRLLTLTLLCLALLAAHEIARAADIDGSFQRTPK